MPDIGLPDTSVLIVLEKIGGLSLLHEVYTSVYTTPEVIREFGRPIPEWLQIRSATNLKLQEKLEAKVDRGEASAMALYFDIRNATMIIDDRKARKLAKEYEMKVTGTLGVLSKSKSNGVISELKPFIYKLLEADFRINRNLIDELLKTHHEHW